MGIAGLSYGSERISYRKGLREMTLQELYQRIGGDYDQAMRVLRMEKLVDKHIRKIAKNGVVEQLLEAGKNMDSVQLFESAHALKGICSNLGLMKMAEIASEISEEYRPESSRRFTDEEVRQKLEEIGKLFQQTVEGISLYEG